MYITIVCVLVSTGTSAAYVAGYDAAGLCQIYKSSFPYTVWPATNLCTGAFSLNNIRVLDSGAVVAVGAAGAVMVSTTQGSSWTTQTITTADLYSISSLNATAVVGGTNSIIFITKNSGLTWVKLFSYPNPSMTLSFNTLSMVSKSVIYAAGSSGFIVYTKNGGRSWRK